jgi:hypothetical protein
MPRGAVPQNQRYRPVAASGEARRRRADGVGAKADGRFRVPPSVPRYKQRARTRPTRAWVRVPPSVQRVRWRFRPVPHSVRSALGVRDRLTMRSPERAPGCPGIRPECPGMGPRVLRNEPPGQLGISPRVPSERNRLHSAKDPTQFACEGDRGVIGSPRDFGHQRRVSGRSARRREAERKT